MNELNMKQTAGSFGVEYEAFRKYIKAIRGVFPNYAPNGIMSVRELGYITFFMHELKTTNERNKVAAALKALVNAVDNDNFPFMR